MTQLLFKEAQEIPQKLLDSFYIYMCVCMYIGNDSLLPKEALLKFATITGQKLA